MSSLHILNKLCSSCIISPPPRIYSTPLLFVSFSSTKANQIDEKVKHNATTIENKEESKIISIQEAWPILQERFDRLKNEAGQLELLSKKNQVTVNNSTKISQRQAAVLVLLLTVDDQPSILFTRRATHLNQHAAEISFPGGHCEPQHDTTLIDTAIREAIEELYPAYTENQCKDDGQQQHEQHVLRTQEFRTNIHILGTATSLPSIRGVPVTPVLASMLHQRFTGPVTTTWSGNSTEVDLVFSVPLIQLLQVETTHTIPATRFNFTSNDAPIYPVSEDQKIWGLTAYILRPVLSKLLKPVFFPSQ